MTDTIDPNIKEAFAVSQAPRKRPVIEIDFEKYLKVTEKFEQTEEQQRQYIAIMHQIMLTFVDMGYDLHPVQHIPAPKSACGQVDEMPQDEGASLADVIKSLVTGDINLDDAESDDVELGDNDLSGSRLQNSFDQNNKEKPQMGA
ncbi:hypothetical protein A8B75_18745 [Sphingomonadales bacterium EhC05]|nr:hypothetical protein A8B75_18745 [Sphingomonadales bacterium EhC05]